MSTKNSKPSHSPAHKSDSKHEVEPTIDELTALEAEKDAKVDFIAPGSGALSEPFPVKMESVQSGPSPADDPLREFLLQLRQRPNGADAQTLAYAMGVDLVKVYNAFNELEAAGAIRRANLVNNQAVTMTPVGAIRANACYDAIHAIQLANQAAK